jgi:Zn-dependent protease
MHALKSLLRWYFAFAAMFLIPASLVVLVRLFHAPTASRFATFAAMLAAGLLSAMSSWTTRNPGLTPSPWGLTASFISFTGGALVLVLIHRFTLASPELLLIVAGATGLIVFSRRAPAAAPRAKAPGKPARIPGDRTNPWLDRAASLFFTSATWMVMSGWYPWARVHHLHAFYGLPLLLLIAAVALVTAVMHEAGHALAAHAFGMKLLAFNAGPFQWRKQEGKWSFHFKTSGILGGNVHVLPTHPDQPAWHDICMVAAGPLVNICTGPIFFWAALHVQGTSWQPAWFFFALMASFALLVAGFNLLPFRSATGSYSDGARILQLLTNSPVVELQRIARRLQSAQPANA